MADMMRFHCAWQNWPGAPGVSTFYAESGADISTITDALRAFWQSFVTYLPTGLTIQVPSTGDIISDTTGAITGAWSDGTPVAVVTGTAAGVYAGNAGAVVHWLTGAVINGRRLRGRTFLVPLIGSAYDANGSLSATTITAITNAATTLVAAIGTNLLVWHRPVPPMNGSSADIVGFRIPDLAVSLRSRRI